MKAGTWETAHPSVCPFPILLVEKQAQEGQGLPGPVCKVLNFFPDVLETVGREAAGNNMGYCSWRVFPCHPWEPGHVSPPHSYDQIAQDPKSPSLEGRGQGRLPDVLAASEGPSAPSWGDRELEVGVWSEATLACGISLLISLETLALLQRRLPDARTMEPFAEMFRVADRG